MQLMQGEALSCGEQDTHLQSMLACGGTAWDYACLQPQGLFAYLYLHVY